VEPVEHQASEICNLAVSDAFLVDELESKHRNHANPQVPMLIRLINWEAKHRKNANYRNSMSAREEQAGKSIGTAQNRGSRCFFKFMGKDFPWQR
jgi:hypothetical protein